MTPSRQSHNWKGPKSTDKDVGAKNNPEIPIKKKLATRKPDQPRHQNKAAILQKRKSYEVKTNLHRNHPILSQQGESRFHHTKSSPTLNNDQKK
ncbi:hypothetical protein V6N11_019287 [Hibiscus sabdariffa]|uniref:Uncharacterized protein n=1 Tax=Hibiscus sabdariffa TaxID=183260 RepID=A0ABR2R1Y8_9ROSI